VNLAQATDHARAELQRFGQRHRRGLVATAVALLAGFGITAVATVAVAPLLPEAAQIPQRLVAESVQPEGLQAQLDALANHELSLTRSDITRSTDSPEALLARLGVIDAGAASFLRTDPLARQALAGRGGKLVQARTGAHGTLESLVFRFQSERSEHARTHFTRLTVAKADGRWIARTQAVAYGSQMRLASGTIRSTLFAATDEAGIPDAVAAQIAEIFSADIDFHRELKKGDTFHLVYESLTADGEPVPWSQGAGRVLAAEFVNNQRAHQALWFVAGDGRGSYFTPAGHSKRKSFLASPMEFSRVSSGFAMRLHPIFRTWRQHNGVDYAAPKGTPVRSVADGVVDFAGWQSGYGNVIEVRHGNGKSTLYAHLSRSDVKKGQRVEQGQRIGAVGATGWATGPHLHFEFRVNGVHQDPLAMARQAEVVALDAGSRLRFAETLAVVQTKLDIAETLAGPRGQAE
jgi:murein DD-endopeptidase MepM/ murein hydrolase activator NlpD